MKKRVQSPFQLHGNKLIPWLNSQLWHKFGEWESTTIVNELSAGFFASKFLSRFGFPQSFRYRLDIDDNCYMLVADYERLLNFYLIKIQKNPNFLTTFADMLDELSSETLRKIKTAKQVKELFSLLRKPEDLAVAMTPIDQAIVRYIEHTRLDASILLHMFPLRRAYMILERLDFLKLVISYHKKKSTEKEFIKHAERFGWMNNVNWRKKPHQPDFYKQQVKLISLTQAQKELASLESKSEQTKALRKFRQSHSKLEWKFLHSLRRLLDAKMLNWDVVGLSQNKWHELLAQNKYLSHVPYDLLVRLTSQEIVEVSAGKLSVKAAVTLGQERMQYVVKIYSAEKNAVVPVSKKDFNRIKIDPVIQKANKILGSVAFAGKVQGEVCLIHGPEKLHAMKKGGVLVTPMTNPDMMPAIVKASAIVTDQGGILCHAAIVSRELKIPCIIGTKIATKVLKDGDMVEVDANNGIVRKIK